MKMRHSTLRAAAGFFALCAFAYACTVPAKKNNNDDDDGAAASSSSGITAMCEEQCVAMHPDGQAAYDGLRSCLLCGACFDVCTTELGAGLCEAGVEDIAGCSAMVGTCAECVNGACALEQLPETTFAGVCGVAGQICADQPACVSLNNCVSNCTQMAGSGPTSTGVGGSGGSGGSGGASGS